MSIYKLLFIWDRLYLNSIMSFLKIDKKSQADALKLGPKTTDGNEVAWVVNTIANTWKHSDEWYWNFEETERFSKRTREDLNKICAHHVGDTETYLYSNIIYDIVESDDSKFKPLLGLFESWRNEVREEYEKV